MLRAPRLLAWTLLVPLALCASWAQAGWQSDILAPTMHAPIAVPVATSTGAMVQLTLRTRSPLTPPPGVQSDTTWLGWSATLRRSAHMAMPGTSAHLAYAARIVRIRPLDGLHQYTVWLRLSPWTPAGRYDIELQGPGFRFSRPQALCVGACEAAETPLSFVAQDAAQDGHRNSVRFRIRNSGTRTWQGDVELAIAGPEGVRLYRADNTSLPLVNATFARCTAACSVHNARLLVFRADWPPGDTYVRASLSDGADAQSETVSPASPHALDSAISAHCLLGTAAASDTPLLWDFTDGDAAVGPRVCHRWTHTLRARARIHAFDAEGRLTTQHYAHPFRVSHRAWNAGCTAVMGEPRALSLLKLFFF